jgi:hypothetical protein
MADSFHFDDFRFETYFIEQSQAATIASPQVPPVDVTSAPSDSARTHFGVSDRRTKGVRTLQWAHGRNMLTGARIG